MQSKAPCLGCKERCYLCHAHCDRYADWTKQRKEMTAKRIEELRVEDFIFNQGARRRKLPDSKIRREYDAR